MIALHFLWVSVVTAVDETSVKEDSCRAVVLAVAPRTLLKSLEREKCLHPHGMIGSRWQQMSS